MTLTDKHVSDERINKVIEYIESTEECFRTPIDVTLLEALLELKQRRAESRIDDFLHKAMNGIEDKAKTTQQVE